MTLVDSTDYGTLLMKGGANRINNTILIENSYYLIGSRPDCKECYVIKYNSI
jgi:hypothetical protein